MKTIETTLTSKEIKSLNINEMDVLSFDFQTENGIDKHFLMLNGVRILAFSNWKDRKKSFDKIKRMGYGLGWKMPILTDEEEGIIQASKNGENPFAYSIICANPKYNQIVK